MRRAGLLTTTILAAMLGLTHASCGSDSGGAASSGTGDDDASAAAVDGASDATSHDAAGSADASDASDASAPTDAASDGDAADGAPPICATYTTGSLRTILPDQGDTTGAIVAYEGCAKTATAGGGVTGGWSLDVSQLASFYRVTRTGWRTTLSPELPAKIQVGATPPLLLVGTAPAGYDAGKAHVLLHLLGPNDDCTLNGNTVALVGHPEAVVHYVDTMGNDVGASTSAAGLVWITDVVPGASTYATFALTPAVAGCKLSTFGVSPYTERVPLVIDTVAAATMLIGK